MKRIAWLIMTFSFTVMIAVPVRHAVSTQSAEEILTVDDALVENVVDAACDFCLDVLDTFFLTAESVADRHHRLYGLPISDPTDAPNGTPGELFVCASCHVLDTSSGSNQFVVERNCRVCHETAPDRHHLLYGTSTADLANYPHGTDDALLNCTFCHAIDASSGSNQFVVERDCRACHQSTQETEIKIVVLDIKPNSPKNRINLKSKGIFTAAIIGSQDCDVTEIDVSSLLLEGRVAPLRSSLRPGANGYEDLTLRFSTNALNAALGDPQPGRSYDVSLTGTLKDGPQIAAIDTIFVSAASSGNSRNTRASRSVSGSPSEAVSPSHAARAPPPRSSTGDHVGPRQAAANSTKRRSL